MLHTLFTPAHLEATTQAIYCLGRALEHHARTGLLHDLGWYRLQALCYEMREGSRHAAPPALAEKYGRSMRTLENIYAERQALAGK